MDSSPLEFVQAMQWEYRLDGDRMVIKECPVCHSSDWAFSMNAATGMWTCSHTAAHANKNVSGSLVRLRRILRMTVDVQSRDTQPVSLGYSESVWVENSAQALVSSPQKMAEICDEWAVSEDVVRYWKLGWWADPSGKTEWLVIPHLVDGVPCGVRSVPWFGYAQERGVSAKSASPVLFNEDCLRQDQQKEVVLCDSERDAILFMWASGKKNVVGMPGGASALSERWFTLLEPVETIYVVSNRDESESEDVTTLVRRLGEHRVKIVPVPDGTRLPDMIREKGPQAIPALLEKAHEPQINNIQQLSDIFDDMICAPEVKPLPAPSKSVTKIMNGGVRPGQVVVITAPPKIGKTSYALTWANYVATKHNVPSLVWCVEMPATDLASMTACVQFGTGRKPNAADLFIAKHTNVGVPLYIAHESNITLDVLIQTFKDAYRQKGVRFFVFDNIHFMVRNAENKVTAIEDCLKALKSFALEYGVYLVLIAQPSGKGGKRGQNMDYYDIGWSSSFASDADTIIILHRERVADTENSFRPEMMVKVDAGRYTSGGMTFLNYYGAMLQFTDMPKSKIQNMILEK